MMMNTAGETNLKVRTGHGLCELIEERLLHLGELARIHDFEDVFHLVEEHDLLRTVHLGPVAEQTNNHLLRERGVFFQKLHNAVGQLRVVHAQALHLMQRNQDPGQEEFVFLLQRQSEAVDDGSENLQELGDPVESLRLIDELEEDIVDGASDVRSEIQEFPVDPVQRCLEEIPFAWIFRVEEFQ